MNRLKTFLAAATLMAGTAWQSISAQVVYVEDDEDDVVVKDEEGNDETIKVPEAMLQDIDSLLSQYHAKIYLKTRRDMQHAGREPVFRAGRVSGQTEKAAHHHRDAIQRCRTEIHRQIRNETKTLRKHDARCRQFLYANIRTGSRNVQRTA